jgi:predicted nucleic acid-binding protein
MYAVMDSSSLIFSFRVPTIYVLILKRYEKILIPKAVFDETVIAGKLLAKPEVQSIENEIAKGKITVNKAGKAIPSETLGLGERQAIALAAANNLPLFCDDHKAHIAASVLEVKAIPLTAFLLWAYRNRKISQKEAFACLDLLITEGYRLKLDVYLLLRKEIEKAASKN